MAQITSEALITRLADCPADIGFAPRNSRRAYRHERGEWRHSVS